MDRKQVVVGNWKMQLSHKAAVEALLSIKKMLEDVTVNIDAVLCPSFTALPELKGLLEKGRKVQLGAQNVHWEERGAWTGEVAVSQLSPFVRWCIVGHSERRALTGETDEQVQRKARLLLTHGITPVVCLGETLEERQQEQTVARVTEQVMGLLAEMTRASLTKLVVAYEPIWAISANNPVALPEPAEVAGTMLLIRKLAAERFGSEAAERLRIIYGGSVNPDNVAAYVSEPGVDGVLPGSASVKPAQYVNIVKTVQEIGLR